MIKPMIEKLQKISRTINNSLSLKKTLSVVARETAGLLNVPKVVIFLKLKGKKQAQILGVYDQNKSKHREIGQLHRLDSSHPISRTLMVEGKTVVISDVQKVLSGLPPLARKVLKNSGAQAFLGIPLRYQRRIVGALVIDETRRRRHFTTDEVSLAKIVAYQAAASIVKAQTYGEIKSLKIKLAKMSSLLLDRRILEKALQQPQVYDSGNNKPSLKIVTILLADIRDSSRFVDKQNHRKVVCLYQDFYQIAHDAADKYNGFFNEVKGDEVLIYFPSVLSALQASLMMREKMPNFREKYQLGSGICIHTGKVLVGFIGTNRRLFHAVTGKTVYLAKRLLETAKIGEILVSEESKNSLSAEQKRRFLFSPLQGIVVKGFRQSIRCCRLYGLCKKAELA